MGRACRCPAAPTSGGHPDLRTLIFGDPDLRSIYEKNMALLTGHLVGARRGARLCSMRCSPTSIAGALPRSSSLASPGSARLVCSPSSPFARTRSGHLVLSGSASELERDLPFSVFVDALDEYLRGLDRARLVPLWTTTSGRSSRTSFRRSRRWRRSASWRCSTSVIAGTGRCARCSSSWRDAAARTRPRRPALGRLGLDRVARRAAPPAAGRRPCSWQLAVRPRQVPERLSAALERGAARTRCSTRIELGAADRRGGPRAGRRRRPR